MNTLTHDFLVSLIGTNNWNPQLAQVREWASAGQVEHLIAIAATLTDQMQLTSVDVWVQQSIFDNVIQTLAASPGFPQAEAALTVLMMPQPSAWPRRRWRSLERWYAHIAECLAQWQPPDVLLALFERHSHEARYLEMLACLVQEMTLRGYAVTEAASDFWHKSVINTQHPLGWLPITLLAQEKIFPKYLPQRRLGSNHVSWADPGLENDVVDPLPAPIEMNVHWEEAKISQEGKTALEAAVFDWTQNSNGKIESHIFRFDVAIPAAAVTPAVVLTLPLDFLAGTEIADLRLVPYPVSRALALLFCAASGGGAYTTGYDGAYGRLAAWRSAGALIGADKDAGTDRIASLASDCAWFSCRSQAGWFHDVAWDVGLLALRPDGLTLAVLAATDTD